MKTKLEREVRFLNVYAVVFVFCFIPLAVQGVSAQERLTVTQAVARTIAPGATDKYSISLNEGL